MDMLKVMIVDDEILANEYLRDLIPWENHGFRIVAEATSSKEALTLYEECRPDIIIADICMPAMDGLELSSRILSMNGSVKIILLTSYKKFEYAKKAIELGVFNYLLKNEINEESLMDELIKAREAIDREVRSNCFVRKYAFRRILEGKSLTESEKTSIAGILESKEKAITLLLLQLDVPYPIFIRKTGTMELPDSEKIAFRSLEFPEHISHLETVEMGGNRWAFLFSEKKHHSSKKTWDMFYPIAVKLLKEFKEAYGETASVVIAGTNQGVGSLTELYRNARETLEFAIFMGRGKIYSLDSIKYQHACKADNAETGRNIFTAVGTALNSQNIQKIYDEIDFIFLKIASDRSGLDYLKTSCRELIRIMESYRNDHGLIALEEKFNYNKIDTSLWYSITGIKQWFADEFRRTMEEADNWKVYKYSRKIQEAIHFIHNNYQRDISVKDIADEVQVSEFYISRIFKQETGLTFLEYLTKYRIEVAKRLLAEGNYKMYEVAEMVGYKTSQYFSRVFHKLTGKNPIEFKEGS